MSLLDSTTVSTLGSSTIGTFNDGVYISQDDMLTTLSTSISSALTCPSDDVCMQVDTTKEYVSSISSESLDSILMMIDEREREILDAAVDVAKVKSIGSINNKM